MRKNNLTPVSGCGLWQYRQHRFRTRPIL